MNPLLSVNVGPAARYPMEGLNGLLILFRDPTASAVELLRQLDLEVPKYDDVHTESADLKNLRPTEFQADLVLFLRRGKNKVLGVIVEVQLRRDAVEPYAWPA